LVQVKRHTLVSEYMGEVTTMDVIERRMKKMTAKQHYYFAALEGGLLIDAGPMGSEARFAK
jgi:hypothetical protein